MARLNSWIIILLADFALGAVLLYIPGVWSYEIIIMYILVEVARWSGMRGGR